MNPEPLIAELENTRTFFNRSIDCLTEADSEFAPAEGLMTAAQHIAHTAQTVDWFFEGAFRPEGFDLDFATHAQETAKVRSIAAARAWLDRAFDQAKQILSTKSAEDLTQPLPPGPVMGGAPRFAIVGAITDHSAHHRGALTVYSRLRGHVPAMPYGVG